MKNPLTLEAFAEWLEKQPQDMEYEYDDAETCLLGQYFKACGFDDYADRSLNEDGPLAEVAYQFPERRYEDNFTFGAALSRARALLARDTSLGMRAEDVG